MPEKERRSLSELSLKLNKFALDNQALNTKVAGLTQQNGNLASEVERLKEELKSSTEEQVKCRRQAQSMQQKMEVYKGTMEDQNADRLAMIKEKDALLKEYNALKMSIPELQKMDEVSNKLKHITEKKEILTDRDYANYIQHYAYVQQ